MRGEETERAATELGEARRVEQLDGVADDVVSYIEFSNVSPDSQFCLTVARCKQCRFAGRMLAAVGRRLGPELRLPAAHFRTEIFIFA